MLEFIVSVGVVILCVVMAVIYLYPGSKKVTTVPGMAPSDDVMGNLPDLKIAGSLHEFLMILHKTYGDIASFWFGQQLVVSIASPRLFKQHAKVFDRPPLLFKCIEPFIRSESIQLCNGDEARQRHAAYGRCYSDQALGAYYPTINQLTDELVVKWGNTPPEEHIPLHETCYNLAVSVMLQCSLDKHFNDDSVVKTITRNYDVAWDELERRLVEGDEPEEGSDREKTFQKATKTVTDTLKKVLAEYKNNLPTDARTTLIDVLCRSDMCEAKATADVLTVFVGGFHTTGTLMNWTLYFLATHPAVQQKLLNEIQQVLGVDESGKQCKVTEENANKFVYLRQVLDEALRCSVLATIAARFKHVESELGGHRIPAGTPVIHALGVVCQSEDLYPDPTKFDPERFSPENRKKLPPFAFEPFGFAGKRKCFGYKFALIESTIILAAIVGHFKLTMVPGQQKVQRKHGLVTKPSQEIWITVTKRN